MLDNTHPKRTQLLPLLILLGLSLIWGSSFILIKKGLAAFTPGQVGTIRIIFAWLVMLPIALKHLRTVYKIHWKKIIILGLVANLVPAVLFAVAETRLSSSVAGILNALTPVFTLLAGTLFFRTAVRRHHVLGMVVAFSGSILLSIVDAGGKLENVNSYALFVVAATLCYGISSNIIKTYFQKVPPFVLTALAMFSVGPLSAAYLFSTDFIVRLSHGEEVWISMGYLLILGVIGTAFALALLNILIQKTSAIYAATVTYLIPVVAVMWGLLDGEVLYPVHFGGMVLIISGIYIINKTG